MKCSKHPPPLKNFPMVFEQNLAHISPEDENAQI